MTVPQKHGREHFLSIYLSIQHLTDAIRSFERTRIKDWNKMPCSLFSHVPVKFPACVNVGSSFHVLTDIIASKWFET